MPVNLKPVLFGASIEPFDADSSGSPGAELTGFRKSGLIKQV